MISDLPMDLAMEILSRLPLKYMRAMRLTCKKWDSLSKSGSFSKRHIGKTSADDQFIVWIDYKLFLVSIVVDNVPASEPKGKLTFLNESDEVRISAFFHCDGLLLCILENDTSVVVWNPYWGQTRWVETKFCRRPHLCDTVSYSFGYEDINISCRNHKILRSTYRSDLNMPSEDHQYIWFEIYSLDSGLWKTLQVNPHWDTYLYQRGVSVKGNTYWCVTPRNKVHILCFDFTRERFGPLLRMPLSVYRVEEKVVLSCVREEKLAVLRQNIKRNEIEVWITTRVEAENVSWSIFLTVDMKPNIPLTIGSFFIDEEKKVAMGFEQLSYENKIQINSYREAGYLRELFHLGGRKYICKRIYVCSYLPSLLQIKQGMQ